MSRALLLHSLDKRFGPCCCGEDKLCALHRRLDRGVRLLNRWRAARRREALRIALELVRARSLTVEETRLAKELDVFELELADEAYDTACRAQGFRWDRAFPSEAR